jgi:Zn-dependent peptidase ImmA (M78 family)
MQTETFNPVWLVIARQSRGKTQKDLAESLSVNQGWLSRIESGLRPISEDKVREIASVLDYPVEFFNQADPPYFTGRTDIFHRKTAVADKVLDRINSQLVIIATALERLLQGVEIAGADMELVDLDDFRGSIEEIAQMVRANWGVPRGPVKNLTQLIENAKGIVIPFDFGTRHIDAISFRLSNSRPVFFTNTCAPGDRLRFTLCHELGHMIMHQGVLRENREDEANRFAAEFLMPAHQIMVYLDNLSLGKLAALKLQWRVSMAALLKRAQTLSTITPAQAKKLWIQMSQYKQREPEELDIPIETPRLYKEIIGVYQAELDYDIAELCNLFRLSENDTYHYFLELPSHDIAKAAVEEAERLIRDNQ